MKVLVNLIIVTLIASLIGGIGLAFWLDDARWLFLSLAAFIVFFAG